MTRCGVPLWRVRSKVRQTAVRPPLGWDSLATDAAHVSLPSLADVLVWWERFCRPELAERLPDWRPEDWELEGVECVEWPR